MLFCWKSPEGVFFADRRRLRFNLIHLVTGTMELPGNRLGSVGLGGTRGIEPQRFPWYRFFLLVAALANRPSSGDKVRLCTNLAVLDCV